MKHVTHWINGAEYVATESEVPADKVGAALTALRDKAVDGIDPERSGDIYDPATGKVTGTVDFADGPRSWTRPSPRPRRRSPSGGTPRSPSAPRCCSPSASCSTRARRSSPRSSPPSTARCSPTRSARSPAAWRSSSSPAASRTCSRAASPRASRPASTSTRSASRSAWSASSRRSTSRRWCRCGSSRSRSPRATPSSSSRARRTRRAANFIAELWSRGRAARRRLQRRPRRQGGRRRAARRTPTSRASRSSARPPIAKYVYETGTAHGKRVQALGGAKNHMVVLPDADLDLAADAAVNAGFGSAGERCMAISALVAVERVADELVAKIAERMATLRTGDGRRGCDMGPLVTGVHRDKVAVLRRRRRGRGRDAGRRRPRRLTSTATPTASGSARRCSTTSPRT